MNEQTNVKPGIDPAVIADITAVFAKRAMLGRVMLAQLMVYIPTHRWEPEARDLNDEERAALEADSVENIDDFRAYTFGPCKVLHMGQVLAGGDATDMPDGLTLLIEEEPKPTDPPPSIPLWVTNCDAVNNDAVASERRFTGADLSMSRSQYAQSLADQANEGVRDDFALFNAFEVEGQCGIIIRTPGVEAASLAVFAKLVLIVSAGDEGERGVIEDKARELITKQTEGSFAPTDKLTFGPCATLEQATNHVALAKPCDRLVVLLTADAVARKTDSMWLPRSVAGGCPIQPVRTGTAEDAAANKAAE